MSNTEIKNDSSLKQKAIQIKGKNYVLVSDRVIFFNETFTNGSITTSLVSEPNADMVVIKATVTPDIDKPLRVFTGYSQAKWGDGFINKASAIENCETSAVGRALGMMGIGVIDSIASADEIKKAENTKVEIPEETEMLNGVAYIRKSGISKKGKPFDAYFPVNDGEGQIFWDVDQFKLMQNGENLDTQFHNQIN